MHLQKLLTFFFRKNTCELDIVLTRTINILNTKELVKLTKFEQLGPVIYPASSCIMSSALAACFAAYVNFSSFRFNNLDPKSDLVLG